MEWCEASERVKPGSRVVSYIWDEAIVNDMLPEEARFTFVPRGVSTETGDILSPPAIHNADFILLHLNNFVGYDERSPDLPPLDELNAKFEPVFTVKRGDMELAWVYGRKP
ncbi:MAG: hypothetical protein IPK83_16025 [Planctomycetes bacterium]|nr:hypothetical protein [Planctomycetota bacterium]